MLPVFSFGKRKASVPLENHSEANTLFPMQWQLRLEAEKSHGFNLTERQVKNHFWHPYFKMSVSMNKKIHPSHVNTW